MPLVKQTTLPSAFTCWMAGLPAIRETVSALRAHRLCTFLLPPSLPSHWLISAAPLLFIPRLIPAAGFQERSAQDWTWCHQSAVMGLNDQESWPPEEGGSDGNADAHHRGESETLKQKCLTRVSLHQLVPEIRLLAVMVHTCGKSSVGPGARRDEATDLITRLSLVLPSNQLLSYDDLWIHLKLWAQPPNVNWCSCSMKPFLLCSCSINQTLRPTSLYLCLYMSKGIEGRWIRAT